MGSADAARDAFGAAGLTKAAAAVGAAVSQRAPMAMPVNNTSAPVIQAMAAGRAEVFGGNAVSTAAVSVDAMRWFIARCAC